MKNALIALLVFLGADIAVAYPENVRLGYRVCGACHVAPGGGGVLKEYGRGAGEELATYAPTGAGRLFGAVPDYEKVQVGGDTRYLALPSLKKAFLMQADGEVAVHASREVTFAGSVGEYGPEREIQSRRSYVMWQPNDNFAARFGEFFPQYGIGFQDHTLATREGLGLGEGREMVAAELSYRDDYSELFLTAASNGGDSDLAMNAGASYRMTSSGFNYLARAATYVGRATVGGSWWTAQGPEGEPATHTFGPFVMWGVTRELYLLAEWDRRFKYVRGAATDVATAEVGYEVYRGIHVQLTDEYERGNIPGVGLQFFPVPHVELYARMKYERGAWTPLLMAHTNW